MILLLLFKTQLYIILELRKIAETIKDSKKNNISYNEIELEIKRYFISFLILIMSSNSLSFRTYINEVLNKCEKHKCFHLIKTNSQRKGSSLTSIILNKEEEDNSRHSSFFIKKNEKNEFKLNKKRLSQQYNLNMIEQEPTTSSSVTNLTHFDSNNNSSMQKTYRKNLKIDYSKQKIINMFKKCQQQKQYHQQQQQPQSTIINIEDDDDDEIESKTVINEQPIE